jgi:hypothetical protein
MWFSHLRRYGTQKMGTQGRREALRCHTDFDVMLSAGYVCALSRFLRTCFLQEASALLRFSMSLNEFKLPTPHHMIFHSNP